MNVSKIGFYGYTKPAKVYNKRQEQGQTQAQNPSLSATRPLLKNNQADTFRQNLSFGVQYLTQIDTTKNLETLPVKRRRFIEKISAPPEKGKELSRFDYLIINNEELIKSFGKRGLPLHRSRYEFSKKMVKMLPALKFETLQSKMGIQLHKGKGLFFPDYGYTGILNTEELGTTGREGRIKEECERFLYDNCSGSSIIELNELTGSFTNGLPEFINCIGKKQSEEHDYSVDIHSVLLIANLIKDPRYKTLSDDDKFVLKMTALLHDIAKPEGYRDPYHAYRAESLCKLFLREYDLTPEMNERILKTIGQHQWLRWYNLADASEEKINEIVEKYDSPTDYKMALMFAKADLAATSKEVYKKFAPLLEDEPQRPLREAVEKKFNMKF